MNHKTLHINANDDDYGYSLAFTSQDKMPTSPVPTLLSPLLRLLMLMT